MSVASAGDDDPLCAGPAVLRLFGCNLREGLTSLAVVVMLAAATWFQHRYAWLGLFGATLLPILFASLVLLAACAALGPYLRWPAAWRVLLAALMVGAALGLAAYHHWMGAVALRGMADAKVMASAFGVAALAMGVPLWHAQGQARAHHLASLRQAALVAEMKELADTLDAGAFWQIHRGYTVAVKRIASATRGDDGALWVNLRGHPARLPVSQRFQHLFKGM